MRKLLVIVTLLLLAGCVSPGMPEAPQGAVAFCGSIDYTGTWTKSESAGRAIGLTSAELAEKMTVEEVIALAEALGCSPQ